MSSLFPIEVSSEDIPAISGLAYAPNYITEAEEARLVEAIDAEAWDTSWDRRRQIYGGGYGVNSGINRPIPDWGIAIADRLLADGRSHALRFDHMLVNEYLPGQGIALHCDYKPYDRTVVSLSLLAACLMDFRHVASGARTFLLLQRRSLMVLDGDARYEWQHGIARRKNDRWKGQVLARRRRLSVTFRRFFPVMTSD